MRYLLIFALAGLLAGQRSPHSASRRSGRLQIRLLEMLENVRPDLETDARLPPFMVTAVDT
jgi:hypothetical protein